MPLHTRCTQQQNQGIFLQEIRGEEQSPTQASCQRELLLGRIYISIRLHQPGEKKKGTRGGLSCSIGPERFLSPVKERAQHLKRRRRRKEREKKERNSNLSLDAGDRQRFLCNRQSS